jgi:pyridoxamine 5'-phosphate oxidase
MSHDIKSMRRDYSQSFLIEDNMPDNPFDLLQAWLKEATDSSIADANGLALSTISEDGFPTTRIVLVRSIEQSGVTFFTNYASAKAQHIERSSKACGLFFWSAQERQIRMQGHLSQLTSKESDEYFASRPRASQIGAWASPQSRTIKDRLELERVYKDYEVKFATETLIPRPPHWGGYVLKINYFEFWQGRPSRLHDRIFYSLSKDQWSRGRLAP